MPSLENYYFVRVLLIVGSISAMNTDAVFNRYTTMISDIHRYYATSSVFLITERQLPFSDFTFGHTLSREFSKQGVMSLVINIDQLEARLSMYQKRMTSPLIVIFMRSLENIKTFSSVARKINLAPPLWLLIFTKGFDERVCDYCSKPSNNIIPLHFNTELLVSCCGDPELKVWWSLHENKTETSIFGTWTENSYKFRANKNMYVTRNGINGTALRVAVLKRDAGDETSNLHPLGNYFYYVLHELQRVMNFEISSIVSSQTFGSWSQSTQSWSGLVSQIVEGKADLAVAEFSMTPRRLDAVDFTLPLLSSRQQLYVRTQSGAGVQWLAHFQAFDFEVWAIIIIFIVTTPLLMALIKMKSGHKVTASIFFENYLSVWGIFCQQGLSYQPVEIPLRIAYFSLFISALVVSAAYAAALISFLTAPFPIVPIRSFGDLAKDRSYKLIVLRNSAEYDFIISTRHPILMKVAENLDPSNSMPGNLVEAFRRVCDEKRVLFTNELSVNLMHEKIACTITSFDTGRIDNMGMIMPRNSQFTALVNYHIQRFQDTGVLKHLKNNYLSTKPYGSRIPRKEVSLAGIAPILLVLCTGIILAFLILLCEKLTDALTNSMRKYRRVPSHRTNLQKWSNLPRNPRGVQLNVYPRVN